MRRTASSARLFSLLLVWPSTVGAQESTAAPKNVEPKNVEVSVGVSGFPGTDHFGLGVRVSGRTGQRSFVEGGLDWTDAFHTRR